MESKPNTPEQLGPGVFVIFGASGDLTRRKLVPAIYNLAAAGSLPRECAIVGIARSDWDDEGFRSQMTDAMREFAPTPPDPTIWEQLRSRMHYVRGAIGERATFEALSRKLGRVDELHGTRGNYLFYLAISPEFFAETVEELHAVGLTEERDGRWRRVVVEKPFGHDLESAKALNVALAKVLDESQIYRIDHYLGKETVQNILVFRFANGLFEPVWNRRYIDHVQITVDETVGVEQRGEYYESAGALRDMVPNHIVQLLSLIAMEPPTSFEASAVREEKAKVLRAIAPLKPENVLTDAVRGQYGPSEDKSVPGYRSEPKVHPASKTETFAAMRMMVDNWRWANVPFYLRTGKRMKRRVSEIAIHFKRPPFLLFRKTPVEHIASNLLILRIQPEEGIELRFHAKVPGQTLYLGGVAMDFCYGEYFGSTPSTGYETLLHDAMKGDSTLFQRGDMVEAGWSLVQPILDVWQALPAREFPNYVAATDGPAAADELLARDGRRWNTT